LIALHSTRQLHAATLDSCHPVNNHNATSVYIAAFFVIFIVY